MSISTTSIVRRENRTVFGIFAAAICFFSWQSVRAQYQEPRMQQILEPDTGRAFEFRNREAKILSIVRPWKARTKKFADVKPTRTKTFLQTRRAAVGEKNYSGLRKARDSTAAYPAETTRMLEESNKAVATDQIESRSAPTAGRGEFRGRTYPFVRMAEIRGTRQAALDLQYEKQPALTVDEVRELLNKNK